MIRHARPTLDVAAPQAVASPPFLLVTGGKGGVGKSTVALNVSLALADEGRKSLLVDLDLGLANLNVMLGIHPERTVEDYLTGQARLEDCLHDIQDGARLLPAGSGSFEMGRPDAHRRERLVRGLASALSPEEILVGDSPAGIGGDVVDFGLRATRVLVVTTPEPAAMTDAYGVIKALDAFASREGVELPTPDLFVNLVSGAEEARSISEKLRTVCQRFLSRTPRLTGWMPRARAVLLSVVAQEPLVLSEPGSRRALRAAPGPALLHSGGARDAP